LREKLTLEDILEYHRPQIGQYTLFRVHKGKLAGAVCFCLGEDDVEVAYRTKNGRARLKDVSVGGILLSAVERFAEFEGRGFVRLEALDDEDLHAWYRQLGFVEDGAPYDQPGWGRLHPLVKRVEGLRLGEF
jgi:hypothetical protein